MFSKRTLRFSQKNTLFKPNNQGAFINLEQEKEKEIEELNEISSHDISE